ncbi:AfsR/SARP family transcriptional regulator [Nocardia terpenica]|uniref:AfsR/SARP family transcriptional regulator n=1 Tax=Nocardia terpenica TaxID=455432 RepID=UPI002FE2A7B1
MPTQVLQRPVSGDAAEGSTRIDLLGSISVVADGARKELRSSKIRSMLAVLALEAGHVVYYDELVEELWPRELLKNPRNALQAHATRIRKTLEQCANGMQREVELRAVYNGYVLDIPRDFVDCNRFLDLTTRGVAELHSDPARALRLLQQGLGLWRGPALLNTHTGERCRSAAVYLEERRLLAWEDMVSALLIQGDTRQAAAELHRLVAVHPTRERLCALLMLTFYRSGRQCEALRLFHRTRKQLDDELGVEPSRCLARLYEDILAQDSALESVDAVLMRSEFGLART